MSEVGNGMEDGRVCIDMTPKVIGAVDVIAKIKWLAPGKDNQSRRSMGGTTALIVHRDGVGGGLEDRDGIGRNTRLRCQLFGQDL